MKQFATLLSILFAVTLISNTQLDAQTKKEVQFSLDTLTKVHDTLVKDYEELQTSWQAYDAFYEHVKSSLFPAEVQAASVTEGIPLYEASIKLKLTSLNEMQDSLALVADSLASALSRIDELETRLSYYSEILMASLGEASFPQSEKELLGHWDLFLDPVQIGGSPSEAGIISQHPFNIPDSLKQHRVHAIEFAPDELATIYFYNGDKQKCFYSIADFSATSNYSINFSKQDEFKLTMHVSVLPKGLQVSYELPVNTDRTIYYQGLMKK